jgi:hypothetical protein
MSETLNLEQARGLVRPATATDIVYRAYGRPYAGGPAQVITLLASCSYPIGGYTLFFTREYGPDEIYTLMEQPPGLFPNIVTYYAADYTTGVGIANPVSSVIIIDAHGKHEVPVEPLK